MIEFLISLFGEELLREEGIIINGVPSLKLIRIAREHNIKLNAVSVTNGELDNLVDSVLNLKFPSLKSGGTVTFKPNKSDLKSKLEAFYKKYEYPVELVEEKLTKYVNKCYHNPSEYNQALKYYILKDGFSALADDCENNVEYEPQSLNGFRLI